MPGLGPAAPRSSSALRQRAQKRGPGSAGCGRPGSEPRGPGRICVQHRTAPAAARRGTRRAGGHSPPPPRRFSTGTATPPLCAWDRSSEIPSSANLLSCDSRMRGGTCAPSPVPESAGSDPAALSGHCGPGDPGSRSSANPHPRHHDAQPCSPPGSRRPSPAVPAPPLFWSLGSSPWDVGDGGSKPEMGG